MSRTNNFLKGRECLDLIELNGCTCKSCSEKFNNTLQAARQEWNMGNREIKVLHNEYDDAPMDQVVVNGITISNNAEQADDVLKGLFEFLEIDVKITEEWGYDDYTYSQT